MAMGMLTSKVTAVAAQFAPLPVQSLMGAKSVIVAPELIGSAATRSCGDAIERKTK